MNKPVDNQTRGKLNELLMGYHINGQEWFSKDAKEELSETRVSVEPEVYKMENLKAEQMAEAFLGKSRHMGYHNVRTVYWIGGGNVGTLNTLRRNIDPKGQMELDLDPRVNPSDLMVEFQKGARGKFERWLGISAKSAQRTDGKIGFKNPGLGTLDGELGLDLTKYLKKREEEFAEQYGLSNVGTQREAQIKRNQRLFKRAVNVGDELLSELRDKIIYKLSRMNHDQAHQHLLSVWLNAEDLFPPYLKVTGSGIKPPFQVKVENPLENDNFSKLNTGNIKFLKAGAQSITVTANGARLFNMRLKFKGTKMASTVKLSADSL
jgi:hypothetical protein